MDDNKEKLKPCPFCSFDDLLMMSNENCVFISCNSCKTNGPSFEFEEQDKDNFSFKEAQDFVVQRWNYRPVSCEEHQQDEESSVGKAISTYLQENFMLDIFEEGKFLVACDLLSYLKKDK